MHIRKQPLLSLFIVGCSLNFFAPLTTAASLSQERQTYLDAKAAFEKNDFERGDKLTAKIKNYPLTPYLHVRQIQKNIQTINDKEVAKFIQLHQQSPFADDVQMSRLNQFIVNNQPAKFIQAYQQLPITRNRYVCALAWAEFQTGQTQIAMEKAKNLWVQGHSQDNACDPLFDEWMKQGNPTAALATERFWNAINEKNYALAQYVERFITSPNEKSDIELFWAVQKNPNLIEDLQRLKANNPHHGIIAVYAIRQIARKDLDVASTLWIKVRDKVSVDPAEANQLTESLGLRYAKGFRDNAESMLQALDPNYQVPLLTEWHVRLELANQNWKRALELIGQLPQDFQQEDRWIYWRETVKRKMDPVGYKADYSEVVKQRSFYGFLASEITNDPFYLNHKPSGITAEQKNRIKKLPAMKRMAELLALDYQYAARVEWNHLSKALSKEDQLVAAHIASDWGWYDQAIRGASQVKAWNDLDIRFPNPHDALFAELTKERGIYHTWAIAIARQESAFYQEARSRVGARGLMQLMPATAKHTAKRFSVNYRHPDELFTPRTNISLGTAYLADMQNTFAGNRVYATAAYNAGPGRVKSWIKARGHLPIDVWIETIPFDETRNYVQNVLSFSVIYDIMASRPAHLLSDAEAALLAFNTANTNRSAL